MRPLVSILIPAYNAEPWIGDTIRSALAQTWPRKEIIVVDDGSRDRTPSIARQFASKNVCVVTQENQGAAAARNCALALSQGEFIQWLDADDLLAPGKIAKQVEASDRYGSERMLFSSAWGHFYYRIDKANFASTSLWCDLSPVEWLASDAIRFVPNAKVFYRASVSGSLSSKDESDKKLVSQFLSMQLHVGYVRSLEDSERVRAACLNYLQSRFLRFYPERVAFVEQLQQLAAILGGRLEVPQLSWNYSWMQKVFGWKAAKRARQYYNRCKSAAIRFWDKSCFMWKGRTFK